MKVTMQDQIYGAVLRKFVRHGGLLSVDEVGDKAGHFLVNGFRYVLVKFSTGDGLLWRFTFRPEDVATLVDDHYRAGVLGGSFLCLVCGTDSICSLSIDEWSAVLNPHGRSIHQTIRISRAAGCQLEVSGTQGKLPYKIPASRFPSIILGGATTSRLAA